MTLSALSSAYLVKADSIYWHYFQLFVLALTSTLTGMLLVHCGQEVENEGDEMLAKFNNVRWVSFNTSNRRHALLILTVAHIPLRLKFTDTVSFNYELGIKVVRNLYSFATVFANISNFNT
ncbi:hypothetical protein Zmor_015020 [Zophobas morio]|uniref:Uncharacterized protein n=1 Tax=Zophobas morio TaxID=2755281 RepID=A0AA38MH73_9CUCU|nr:hypothetical protein Zmor_015020 [Zophobas morio]